jgi:uncharacterized protein YndB with AHSA1/START domain
MADYERTFTVSVPPARAFRAFTDPADIEVWFAERFSTNDGRSNADTVGGEMHFDPVEVVPGELLHYHQWAEQPDRGLDVTVTFEATETGTRITVTQSGFGGPTRFTNHATHRGMDEAYADLVLYLERGIPFARHRDAPARAEVGADFVEVPGGLAVAHVLANSFAAEAGLEPGDVMLTLDDAPVFDHHEIAFVQRAYREGDELEVRFARDGVVHTGRGRLGVFEKLPWVPVG